MTLEETIRFIKQALENVNHGKRVHYEFRFTFEQIKQLLEWLWDYKELKAHFESLPDWIPCSERLPETTEEGLGVLYSDCSLVASSKTGWMAMAYHLTDGEKSWWEFADAQNKVKIDWDEVTHWMPLPEPPKAEDKA